jgi:class 3 adenylate cyclase/predicted ATPase
VSSGAERRQLTVLFCDLVESTELAGALDPEDLRDVVRDYQAACASVVATYDGHVAQYLGDGLLVYFGYPTAHEDDPQRAVRSGLGIVEAIAHANPALERMRGVHLAVRVGIHTGDVVAGEMGAGEQKQDLAVGQAPNVAARLQGLAEPDTVVLSAATQRLVAGYFALEPLGPRQLKGVAEPLEVYRAIHESAARTRLEAATGGRLTPLVGREAEAQVLIDRWTRVEEGTGQVVLISGEPGIGKSRLIRMLEEHVAVEPSAWLTACQCSPYHQATALFPFIELLERVVLRFGRDDPPRVRSDKLEGWLVQYGFDVGQVHPLLGSLLGLPPDPRYPPPPVTPERQKQLTIEALVSALERRASEQLVLFVIEDVHWADPTTLDALAVLVQRVPAGRLMAVITYRPDARPDLADRPGATELVLGRLEAGDSSEIVARLTDGMTLPDEVRRQIIDRTDGIPLFVEELTKTVLESGLLRAAGDHYELAAPLPPMAIPTTLSGSLTARLDRLGDAKPVAQLAAVIGREFGVDLLQAVAAEEGDRLGDRIDRLVETGLLEARGAPGDVRYAFKHALIQEAAYQSLLRSQRREDHARVAQALLERFRDTSDGRPETIAYHLTEAGRPAEAIPHWVAAGQEAMARSANLEAGSHLSTALQQLATLPESPERAGQELGLLVLSAVPLTLTRGWASPEVGERYERASQLVDEVGEAPQLFPTRVGLLTYYLVRGQMEAAYDLGVRDLELAERFGDPDLLVEAELDRGTTSYYLGRTREALAHLDRAAELYDVPAHHPHVFMYGKDPGAVAFVHRAGALWLLGRPDSGLVSADAGRALAGQWFHPFSALWAGVGQAFSHQVRGDAAAVAEVAGWIVSESVEQVFPNWLAQGQVFLGWALTKLGEVDKGLGMMRDGLGLWEMTGAALFQTYLLSLLADGQRVDGRFDEAMETVAQALDHADRTEERFWEAELYRLRGELRLDLPSHDIAAAEADYARALEGAAGREQWSLHLRAATSQARLWRAHGRVEDARELLAGALGALQEGHDTRDLVDARAVLTSMATTSTPGG